MRVLTLLIVALFVALSFSSEAISRSGPLNQDDEALREYWTAERLQSAIPKDTLTREGEPNLVEIDKEQLEAAGRQISPVFLPAKKPTFSLPDTKDENTEISKRGLGVFLNPDRYTQWPWRAIGKIFFSQGGLNYVCSGSVVKDSVVLTAGHCIYDNGAFASNLIFIPGYYHGAEPFGRFSAFQLVIHPDWSTSRSFCRDYGFAVVNKLNGNKLSYYVGYLGTIYNGGLLQIYTTFGYPHAAPFNGAEDYWVQSAIMNQDAPTCIIGNPKTLRINSDSAGGASGGPWIYDFNRNNYVNGLNSYGYSNDPKSMYGPYFDGDFGYLLNYASTISPP